MRRNSIWAVLSVLVVAGCDNVNWGGVEIAIVPPPQVSAAPQTGSGGTGSDDAPTERLPEGPVLYYVVNTTAGPTMIPVGEISGDSLIPIQARQDVQVFSQRYIAEHLRQGAEFVLYRRGSRVGTFVVQSATAPEPNTCPALPRAIGALELTSGAEQIPEYLAIAERYAPEIRRRAGAEPEVGRTMQVLAPILAEQMIRKRQAPLPGNWQRAMEQLQPIPVSGMSDPGFATTFLVGDTLGPGADNEGYSLFYIGVPARMSYDTVFVNYTNYAEGGKAAPRVVDFLDWNRDDQPELLLQVYGNNDVWFETVGRTQAGGWRRTFRARCSQGTPSLPAPAPGAIDTMTTDTAR